MSAAVALLLSPLGLLFIAVMGVAALVVDYLERHDA